jgi:hypothetical protein
MMTMDEFFADAKRLGCRMHLDPEDQRAAFDAQGAEIERLRAALDRYSEQDVLLCAAPEQQWQLIETAPKASDLQILTYRHEYGMRRQTNRPEKHTGQWFQTSYWSDKFGLFTGWPLNIQPTHWMPLPPPPTKEPTP